MRVSATGFALCLSLAAVSTGADEVLNVRACGAKGDGQTLDTAAIQKAFDAAGKTGGTIEFPAGSYVSGPLILRGNNVTVQLDEGATLFATTNQSLFLKGGGGDWLAAKTGSDFVPFITGKDMTGLAFTGKGTIDGNGAAWWEAAEKARRKVSGFTLPRPNLIVLTRCRNVRMTGITLANSMKFHFVPTECDDVWVEGVTILAPDHAANTDGIDPSGSRRVTITRCVIDVGDDNIAIKAGKKVEGREFASEDITVTDCMFKRGHGMSIGSETAGGVKNVVVRNCTFVGTENGLRIKTTRGKGGRIEELLYENIFMTNVAGAITFTCYYPKIPTTDAAQAVTAETPKFKNIQVRNLTATSTKGAGVIVGLPESLVENVLLENVEISATETGLEIRHAKGIELKGVNVVPKKGEPILARDAEVKGLGRAIPNDAKRRVP